MKVTASIGKDQDRLEEIEFLVDTGGFYTALPPSLRDRLGLIPSASGQTQIADGSIVDVELAWAYVKLNGREGMVPVEIMNVPEPMLGVTALEALGMKVNPVSRQLEVVSPFTAPPTVTRFRPTNQ